MVSGSFTAESVQLTLPKFSLRIRSADTEAQRSSARRLISERYAWRGYGSHVGADQHLDQLTLVAADQRSGSTIATLTVGLDGQRGLLAERLYPAEVQCLRNKGSRLCEVIKFAVRDGVSPKQLLPKLFHVAFIYAYHLQTRSDLVIEVTPRHARFYRRQLHFEVFGGEKLNPRVNTRGVLLRLDLDHAAEQIDRHGGEGESSPAASLYPYALSPVEERAICSLMVAGEATVGVAA